MKSLALIVNESNQIEQMLMESGGEITPDLEAALAVRDLQLSEKVDGYSHIMDRFAALETHYKEKAEFFSQFSKRCGNVQDRLKNNIKFAMQELGQTELVGEDIKFKLTPTSGALIIESEELIPVEFKTEVVKTEIDKKKLKEAAAKGDIPGAKVEPGFSLRMFANTPSKKTKKAVEA